MPSADRRIEDYAMIGDCRSAALVGGDGSIDWLCWPRFDSAACFAALLGDRDNGRWLVQPRDEYRVRRRYRGNTLVLETAFDTATGGVTVIDFMPAGDGPPSVVRRVCGRFGRVPMRTELVLRFDYGLTVPWVRRGDQGELLAIAGPNRVVLRSPLPLRGEALRSVAEFEVAQGQCLDFVLSYGDSIGGAPPAIDASAALHHTEAEWNAWSARCAEAGRWSDLVRRSLLTVRALTYRPTGGIVAAPTTSLPEQWGGPRNWDYRYCWVRDATLTLLALMRGGYHEEAGAWRDWLARAVAGSPEQLQILYGVAGERDLAERELPWLAGFGGSKPVRTGNAASEQFQLDIFGELAGLLRQAHLAGLPADEHARELLRAIVRHLEQTWREPDMGIWEIRGEPRHFTYSKVMAWKAFRCAVDDGVAENEDECRRWTETADRIHAEVCARAYDRERNCFTQSYGAAHLDASLLLLPRSGFLPPQDPRIAGTVAAIERHLLRDGLVMRYESESGIDGLPPGEGAFLACSFWLVDCYVLVGRLDDARALFERLVALCNDVGLLAEEYDPHQSRMLGNFPQAFSHLALVNAAYVLAGAERGAGTPPS